MTTTSDTCADSVSRSVALPVAPDARSTAVAVFTSGSSARFAANATGTVNTSELTVPAPMPAPVAPKPDWPAAPVTVPQVAMPLAAHVTVPASVTPTGSASFTVTSSASDAPVLRTVTT